MREGEEVAVFEEPKRFEKKPKVTKGKKNSKSPEMEEDEPIKEEAELSEEGAQRLEADLHKIADAAIAAACVLTLLDLEDLPKQASHQIFQHDWHSTDS